MALEHFEVFLNWVPNPVKIFTDHNPLLFEQRYKQKNQHLMRWNLVYTVSLFVYSFCANNTVLLLWIFLVTDTEVDAGAAE